MFVSKFNLSVRASMLAMAFCTFAFAQSASAAKHAGSSSFSQNLGDPNIPGTKAFAAEKVKRESESCPLSADKSDRYTVASAAKQLAGSRSRGRVGLDDTRQ